LGVYVLGARVVFEVLSPEVDVLTAGEGGSSYEASALYLFGPGCPACGVILFERESDTNECVMEDSDGFEGISPEKTDKVEAVGGDGVVEVGGHFFISKPVYYPAVHLEAPGASHGPWGARQY